MRRNPTNPQRLTAANQRRTQARVDQYHGLVDLLRTWELQSDDIQIKFHDDIIKLKARIRNVKNYLLHRSDAKVKI